MMRRIAFALALFACLALPAADASNVLSPHRLAVIGGTRPTLLATTGGADGNVATTRTVSVTPPVGTSLLIAYVAGVRRNSHPSFTFNSITWAGAAMDQLTDFNHFGNRVIDGYGYKMNPTTGVSQNLVFTVNGAWNMSHIFVWMFSGTDPADPFGKIATVENINATIVSTEQSPEYNRPYILAGSGAAKNAGGGNCYSGTNLTVDSQGRDDTDDVFAAAASNAVLTAAGPTTFTLNCASSGTGHITMEFVEIKGP